MGKCTAGAGLTMDEIHAVEAIEGWFEGESQSQSPKGGLVATLRGDQGRMRQRIRIDVVSPHLLHVVGKLTVADGTAVELRIEDPELRVSYRFKTYIRDIAKVGKAGLVTARLELIGSPLLVRVGPEIARPTRSKSVGNQKTRVAA